MNTLYYSVFILKNQDVFYPSISNDGENKNAKRNADKTKTPATITNGSRSSLIRSISKRIIA